MPFAEVPSSEAPRKANRDVVTFLILFVLACLPYSNIFLNQFVYDDGFQVVENPYAHSFKYLRQIFTTTVWPFQGAQGVSNYYRPMMTLGYLLTYKIAGLVPFTFHLVNILLEAIAVWLVFAILRRFSGLRVAFVAAGLFALHPIHTEAVDWIAALTDLKLAVFYIGTFLLYVKLPEAKHRSLAIAAMCACFALALVRRFEHRYPESLDYSWRVLRIRPEDIFGHINLAATLTELGRTTEAEWHFRLATTLTPLSTSAHNAYGQFLLIGGRAEEARAEFQRSADADFNIDAYDELGDIYLARQDFPRAENSFRNAHSGNSFDSHAHFGLARVLEFASRPADALREYETGLAIDPSNDAAKAAANRLLPGLAPQ